MVCSRKISRDEAINYPISEPLHCLKNVDYSVGSFGGNIRTLYISIVHNTRECGGRWAVGSGIKKCVQTTTAEAN